MACVASPAPMRRCGVHSRHLHVVLHRSKSIRLGRERRLLLTVELHKRRLDVPGTQCASCETLMNKRSPLKIPQMNASLQSLIDGHVAHFARFTGVKERERLFISLRLVQMLQL